MDRKGAEKYIIETVQILDPSGTNAALYVELFKRQSKEDFEEMMEMFRDGSQYINLMVPHHGKVKGTLKGDFAAAKKLGVNIFSKINYGTHMPDVKNLVIDLPFRRTSQTLEKGISVSENNNIRNTLTGTVTNASKASTLSFDEVRILSGMGLTNTIKELYNVRGGNKGAELAMNKLITMGRTPSLDLIKQYDTGVESTETMKIMLLGAHIKLDV